MRLVRSGKFAYRNGQLRLYWRCSAYPACTANHCAHPDGSPVGIPANAETRQARRDAHKALKFLQTWCCWSKDELYEWLAARLKLDPSDAHVSKFDKAQCERVELECRDYRAEILLNGKVDF